MSLKELQDKYRTVFEDNDLFEMKRIDNVNHQPHPYVVGPRHIAYAADNWSGQLGMEAIRAGEKAGKCKCAQPKCNIPYDEHTVDTVIFLQLKRVGTNEEANKILKPIAKEMKKDKVDGFVMIETEEKFRITDAEE